MNASISFFCVCVCVCEDASMAFCVQGILVFLFTSIKNKSLWLLSFQPSLPL
jgi:hypothetical protein